MTGKKKTSERPPPAACRLAVAILGIAAVGGCGADDARDVPELARRFGLDRAPLAHWKLPHRLREISGLALAADGRLYAVDDERAVIYEIDFEHGDLAKSFALGDPAVAGDFEGIAWGDGRLWLVTSDGELFGAPDAADGQRVGYLRQDTGFGRRCEIEGLAWRAGRLLLLCKTPRGGRLAVYAWDPVAGEEDRAAGFELPVAAIEHQLGITKLHPSGLAVDASRGTLLVVAAQERVLVELDATGRLVAAVPLPDGGRHPQAEGIEVTENGTLIVADEGGKGRAQLAVYAAQKNGTQKKN